MKGDRPKQREISKSSDTSRGGEFLKKLIKGREKEGLHPSMIRFKELAPSPNLEAGPSRSFLEKARDILTNVNGALEKYEKLKRNITDKSKIFAKRSDYRYMTTKHKLKGIYWTLARDKGHSDRVVSSSFVQVWERSKKEQIRASVLMSTKVKKLGSRDNRAFIEISGIGGFKGWIDKNALEKPSLGKFAKGDDLGQVLKDKVAVVTTCNLETSLYQEADGEDATLGNMKEAYCWTKLRIINTEGSDSSRLQVLLPGGKETAWVEKQDVTVRDTDNPYPKQSPEDILDYARAFLKKSTSYREQAEKDPNEKQKHTFGWGGIYWKRTDSSGFVQTCLRMGGYDLPRNTRSQYKYCKKHPEIFQILTEKDQHKPGDLIFFINRATNKCYHVAIASDEHNYIHSVAINPSPDDPAKRKKLGVIESCLKDCKIEDHEGHDPYQAKSAIGYVVMRIKDNNDRNEDTNA